MNCVYSIEASIQLLGDLPRAIPREFIEALRARCQMLKRVHAEVGVIRSKPESAVAPVSETAGPDG